LNLFTVKADRLILGYRLIKCEDGFAGKAVSLLLGGGIIADVSSEGVITVRERDLSCAVSLLSGRVRFTVGPPLGALGRLRRIECKAGIAIGALFSVIIAVLLSLLVWDVRVEGNVSIPDSEIIRMLEEEGFGVGTLWHRADRSDIENGVLKENGNISWINVNRRGTVAYVRVAESENGAEGGEAEKGGYANIVATRDCIIEEITVTRGTALVKRGDVVREGEILIEGLLPEESGGGFCYAEGTVTGRATESLGVNVERSFTEMTVKKERLFGFSLEIFNFPINILKKYGNSDEVYDIIKEIRTYALFGGARLPVSLTLEYERVYSGKEVQRTDTELTAIARQRMNALLAKSLAASDLIGIKSEGRFTDDGYSMTSRVVFLCEVGEVLEFNGTGEE